MNYIYQLVEYISYKCVKVVEHECVSIIGYGGLEHDIEYS